MDIDRKMFWCKFGGGLNTSKMRTESGSKWSLYEPSESLRRIAGISTGLRRNSVAFVLLLKTILKWAVVLLSNRLERITVNSVSYLDSSRRFVRQRKWSLRRSRCAARLSPGITKLRGKSTWRDTRTLFRPHPLASLAFIGQKGKKKYISNRNEMPSE